MVLPDLSCAHFLVEDGGKLQKSKVFLPPGWLKVSAADPPTVFLFLPPFPCDQLLRANSNGNEPRHCENLSISWIFVFFKLDLATLRLALLAKSSHDKNIYIYIYIEQTLVTSNGNSFFTPQICRCILSLSFIFPHKKNIGPRIPINHQDEYTPLGSLWCQCKPSSRLHPGRPHPHQKSTSCFATYHSLPRFM